MDNYAQLSDPSSRIRDLEEKIRLLKDRILLVGQSMIEERDKNFISIQEMKREIIKMREDNLRIKELLQRVTEQINNFSSKEDILMIQRQLDLLRK